MRTGDWIILEIDDEDDYRVIINIDNISWFNCEESIVTTNDGSQFYATRRSLEKLLDHLGFKGD